MSKKWGKLLILNYIASGQNKTCRLYAKLGRDVFLSPIRRK